MAIVAVPDRSQDADWWIDTVAGELHTTNREFAERVLRCWLQMIRERISALAASEFAAEMPQSIRQIFLADAGLGSAAKRGPAAYTIRFARNAGIPVQDVRDISSATTAAVMRLLPPGTVTKVLDELDAKLQPILRRRAC